MREVGPEQVAFGGYGGEVGVGVHEVFGVFERADDDDAVQEASYCRHEVGRAADQICRVLLRGGRRFVVAGRVFPLRRLRCPGEQE